MHISIEESSVVHLTPSLYGIKIGSRHHPKPANTPNSLQQMWMYRIDPLKYCGLCKGYLRSDWNTFIEHEPVSLRTQWMDLLFDLIFVACVVHIAQEALYSISDDPSNGKYDFVLTVFPQFGILSLFWMEQTMLATHFQFNQTMDQILELFYFAFVLMTGLFIHNDALYHTAFQCAYLMVRILSLIIYCKTYLIPRAQYYAIWHLIKNILVIIVLILFIFCFENGCAIDYFFIYFALFSFEFIAFLLNWMLIQFALPVNVAHIAERFGLFSMLILGESIISIITSHVGSFGIDGVVQIIFVALVFVLCFFIAKLYFECQPNEECGAHNHALSSASHQPMMRIIYICSHQLLWFALLGFGVGLKIAFSHHFGDEEQNEREWIVDIGLPAYSLVFIVVALNVERLSHPQRIHSIQVWLFRIILISVMSATPILMKTMNVGLIFCVMLSCVILLNLVDTEGKKMSKEHKQTDKQNLIYFQMKSKKKCYDSLADGGENRICLENMCETNEDKFRQFLMMLKIKNQEGANDIDFAFEMDKECMLSEYKNAKELVNKNLIDESQIALLMISKAKIISNEWMRLTMYKLLNTRRDRRR